MYFMRLAVFCLLTACAVEELSASQKCVSIVTPDIEECTSFGSSRDHTVHSCTSNDICNKTFHATIVSLEPLSSKIFPHLLRHVLDVCCGKCAKTSALSITVNAMTPELVSSSDFVYPVLGDSKAAEMYGFKFIPLIEAPDAYYISKSSESKYVMTRLINSCLELWPLLVISLLMAIIAGFPVWLLDTWFNKEEFPRSFFIGLFEGFWWAFVSMTTVGYGDKAPRCFVSRLCAVVWILIGIAIFSLFTVSLTTEITSAVKQPLPSMRGRMVGIIKGRLHDAGLVTRKGGYVNATKREELRPAIFELIASLQGKLISGFLLDKYTYVEVTHILRNTTALTNDQRAKARFFKKKTLQTEVGRVGEIRWYGMLLNATDNYEYFRHFVIDNQYYMQICKELHLQKAPLNEDGLTKGHKTHNIFSTEGGMFMIALKVTLIIVAAITAFGLIYEVVRRKACKKPPTNVEMGMTNGAVSCRK